MINHATDYPLWTDMSRNVLGRCSCLASLSRWKTHGGRVVFASVNTALRPDEQCIWMSWITGRLHYVRVENLVGLVEVMSVRWLWVRSTVQSCSSFSKTWCGFNEIILISKCHSLILQIRSIRWVPILTAQRCSIHLPIQYLTSVHHDHEVFQIHRSFMSHIVLLRQFQVHSKSIGYVCLHWVNELREGVIEVGIDLRIHVMSSRDKVLV